MRLIKLRIKNFRGIGSGDNGEGIEVTLDEQNIIFLIGQNNVGKSSILHAYDYFFEHKKSLADDFHNKDINLPIEIEVELKVDESEDESALKQLELSCNSTKNLVFRKIWTLEDQTPTENYIRGDHGEPPSTKKAVIDFFQGKLPKPVWIKGMSTTEDVVKQLQDLIKQAILDRLKEDSDYKDFYAKAEEAIKTLQKATQDAAFTGELKDRLDRTIQKIFPNIALSISNEGDDFDLPRLLNSYTQVQAFDRQKEVNVNLSSQGHGVQRQFILSACKECHDLFASLKQRSKNGKDFTFDAVESSQLIPKTKVLLVEEPELFLHPSGVRNIQRLLYELAENSCFQLISATHSPIMIDLSRPHSSLVRIVKNEQSDVCAYQLRTDIDLKDGVDILRMIRSFNPYVCEAFFSDRVLLVEGPTESVVAKIVLEKFRESGFQNADSITVVDCGGKTTIPLFQKILRHFRIPYCVFHDSDAPTDKNGNPANVWAVNQQIWNEIERSLKEGVPAMRFAFIQNFEDAHNYPEPKNSGGKPYAAWQKAQIWIGSNEWDEKEITLLARKYPAIKYFWYMLTNDASEVHDQNWINERVQKPSRNSVSTDQLVLL
jgi:putative ATP-dependent endonuclease of the OLD family